MNEPHLNRRALVVGAMMSPSLVACASVASLPGEGELADWIAAQRARSITLLLPNISPAESMERDVETRWIAEERWPLVRAEVAKPGSRIRLEGDRFIQSITPRPGSVTAAPRGGPGEPDYFFTGFATAPSSCAPWRISRPPPRRRSHRRAISGSRTSSASQGRCSCRARRRVWAKRASISMEARTPCSGTGLNSMDRRCGR